MAFVIIHWVLSLASFTSMIRLVGDCARGIIGKPLTENTMKLLLTSAGISNKSIRNALVDLLGKPISESSALFVPTAIYAITNGADLSRGLISGTLGDPFCDLGWKTLG